jgi:carbonic anhydrase/acetyltransferase-like protein (isoleucine patch superfamily)
MNAYVLQLLLATSLAVSATAQISVADTDLLRIEQGKQVASGKEMRVWRFEEFKEPMQDWPREVKGAFVELRCEDNKFSEAALILVRDDFRLRVYPAKSLVPEDRTLAARLEANRLATAKSDFKKPYIADYRPYTAEDASIFESDHFTFYVGKDTTGSGKTAIEDPGFMPEQKRWFEKVWTHLGHLGAPLPMDEDTAPKKINVYISGTGLAKHREGFAYGGESVLMHPHALGPGSSVVIHEFTHSVQFYSKGFRNSPYVGWFWECHGNWSTHQFMPGYPPVLSHYAGRAHYELNSSRHNYGSWPFLQVLAEHPKFGNAFPYELWPACKRNERDGALEDPFQTIMRLGAERGVLQDGILGFGDIIGELAARMVTWDFQNQFYHQKEMRNAVKHSRGVPSHRTVLEPVSDHPGWWKPIFSQAPRQYGVNIVDLVPSARSVTADLAGILDEAEGSDWRATLVAYDVVGNCRYSPTVRRGKVSLDMREGESLALAVAATPTKYTPQEFRPGYGRKPRYPYEVSFSGATPASAPPLREDKPSDGDPHPNGGGFVAKSAKVAPTAYVGPNARVLDSAQVSGNARIEDHAVVRQNARIGDNAVVGGFARVTDRAQLSGNARVRGCARVGDQALMTGNARILEYATLDGRGTVSGDVLIKGFGEIHLQPATELTGGTICGEDLEVHFLGSEQEKIAGGMIYGYLNKDLMKKDVSDNRWLYAHWNFNEAHSQVLPDANADCNGIIRGNARFSESQGRGVMTFDGKTYALVEGHIADTRDITFDLQLAWAGGANRQRIFEFGDSENSMLLTFEQGGRPAFVIRRGTESAAVQGTTPVTPGRWTRLTITLKDSIARIYIDGKAAGENRQFPLVPEDVRARAGRIGAGLAGIGFLGELDDFAVFRTGFESVADIPVVAKKPPSTKTASISSR